METDKLIYKQLLAIMAEVEHIGKDRFNSGQKYNFRGIDDVMNELHGLFKKHKVLVLTDVVEQRREVHQSGKGSNLLYSINTYRFTFLAEDGSSVSSTQIGEGMDSGDKASNKAASVALKYALIFMFLIPTEDPKDPENDNHAVVVKQPLSPEIMLAMKTAYASGKVTFEQLEEKLRTLYNATPEQKTEIQQFILNNPQ